MHSTRTFYSLIDTFIHSLNKHLFMANNIMAMATQGGPVKYIYTHEFQHLWSSHSSGGRQDNVKSTDYVKCWSLQRRKVVIQQEAGHTNLHRPGYRFRSHSGEQQEATEWFKQEKVTMMSAFEKIYWLLSAESSVGDVLWKQEEKLGCCCNKTSDRRQPLGQKWW